MREFTVTQENNFCRVFRLPLDYPEGFCFGGGYPVSMQLIDWFNPMPPDEGEYFCNYPVALKGDKIDWLHDKLIGFIKEKNYYKEHSKHNHLVITDYGDTILVEGMGDASSGV